MTPDLKLDVFNLFAAKVLGRLRLGQDILEQLKIHTRIREVPKNSFVVQHGEKWHKLYFIHSGILRMFYTDLEGRDFNKAFFDEGKCIWPVAPMDRDSGILFNLSSIPKAILLECDFAPLQTMLKHENKWEIFALPFAEQLIETKFKREHNFLLKSAAARYAILQEDHPHLVNRIPDYHLASYLGITNVSLSRLKKESNF
ncbi:MAG: Crp/Fnr family transcriptional regulator [Chloroflexota bacterium]